MEDTLGTRQVGKLADVLVVNGRPDEWLDELANVHLVIRDGHVIADDGHLVITMHVPRAAPAPFGVKTQ